MITGSTIYWATRLDAVKTCIGFLSVAITTVSFFSALYTIGNSCKVKPFICSLIGIVLGIAIFAGGITFIPSTKEYAAIKILPLVANSKLVKEELPKEAKNLYDLAKAYLVHELSKDK